MKTIRINREKWIRGTKNLVDGVSTFLWSSKNNAGCCLGHAIHQINRCSWDELNLSVSPKDYFHKKSIFTKIRSNTVLNNDLAIEAMIINDNTTLTDKDRENNLIKLFEKNGYKLEFYN